MKKKIIYYLIIAAIFIACVMLMRFSLDWIEILFDINIPRIFKFAGTLLSLLIFDYLKSIVKKYFV